MRSSLGSDTRFASSVGVAWADVEVLEYMSGSRRDGAEIKVGLTQFPLTNAIVLTDHKTQGLTLDHLILGQMNA